MSSHTSSPSACASLNQPVHCHLPTVQVSDEQRHTVRSERAGVVRYSVGASVSGSMSIGTGVSWKWCSTVSMSGMVMAVRRTEEPAGKARWCK